MIVQRAVVDEHKHELTIDAGLKMGSLHDLIWVVRLLSKYYKTPG